jgi:hypothetical protein
VYRRSPTRFREPSRLPRDGAITFNDVIFSHAPFDASFLFHELVHVEQCRQLGVDRFADLYVRGFLSGGSYEAIPLELNAYELEAAFRNSPRRF